MGELMETIARSIMDYNGCEDGDDGFRACVLEYCQCRKAAVAAFRALERMNYAVVPREPSDEMILRGLEALVQTIQGMARPLRLVTDGEELSDEEAAQRYMTLGALMRSGREVASAYKAMIATVPPPA